MIWYYKFDNKIICMLNKNNNDYICKFINIYICVYILHHKYTFTMNTYNRLPSI